MCPWQWMDGQGPSGQCSPGQEWWIQLHQWIAVINRMAWRWPVTASRQPWAPGVVSRDWAGSGMQVNQASPSQCYISQCKVHALQRRWSALIQLQTGSQIYFNTGLLLSHRAKDEDQASRQVMALHCLPWRSQMKCAASLSASVHGHGEVLKHWPCSGPFWICYGSWFPWTVTTLNRPLLMVSYTVRWSLCSTSHLLLDLFWNKNILESIMYIPLMVFKKRQRNNCIKSICPNGQACHGGCVLGPRCQWK